jgi:hypothetical protein
MKLVRFVLVGFLLLLVVGTLVVNLVTSPEWRVEKSVLVRAEPARVAEFAAELRNWPRFLPPDVGGAAVTYAFGPQTRGVGATAEIQSANGAATLRVTRSDAERVEYDVSFPGGAHPLANTLTWQREGELTRVTLTERVPIGWNPIARLLRGVVEREFGREVQHCLDRLKVTLETPTDAAPPHAPAPAPNPAANSAATPRSG